MWRTRLCRHAERLYPLEADREKVIGIGDASGNVFQSTLRGCDYDASMIDKFNKLTEALWIFLEDQGYLPKVLTAGGKSRCADREGAAFLDETGSFKSRYSSLSSGRGCRNRHDGN